jgi:hypothetical protein
MAPAPEAGTPSNGHSPAARLRNQKQSNQRSLHPRFKGFPS